MTARSLARLASRNFAHGLYRVTMILPLLAAGAHAQGTSYAQSAGTEGGASAVWIFANLSYTGMRAQAMGSTFWKVVTFIFGFPGTLLTLLVVTRGSERAYGIDMPRKR